MLGNIVPWSLRGVGPFLNTYGDPLIFRSIRWTPALVTNPEAPTSVHSIVGHRFVNQYLLAVKSFLRFHNDVAVYVHDDGSLKAADVRLIRNHIQGIKIQARADADRRFDETLKDPFLSRVRRSYTSYLKLFDPTFIRHGERIILLDTDTLFLKYPEKVIDWIVGGGTPWYHTAPRGRMDKRAKDSAPVKREDAHIQTLIMRELDEINQETDGSYNIEQGFCAGFVGYGVDAIDFDKLRHLVEILHQRFGDRIFRWGAEQTIHGLFLCGQGALCLPPEDYMVFTRNNAGVASDATFVHFVGANRFYRFLYPRLAFDVARKLAS